MKHNVDKELAKVASDDLWKRIQPHLTSWEEVNHSPVSTYDEHENPDYKRGMFIDTSCGEARIHSYRDMETLLKGFQTRYPSDVKMVSAGKSEGYSTPENSLDVWALHMFATEKPEQTAFFIAGHHPEYSGPETVYLVAQRLLESYHAGNRNVKTLRKNTHLVFIPQVDVDLYDNLDRVDQMDIEDYLEEGYSWLIDNSDPKQTSELRNHEMNFYTTEGDQGLTEEEYLKIRGFYPFAQTDATKKEIYDSVAKFGKPLLVVDYHESDALLGKYHFMSVRARVSPYFVLAEVAKSYPVMNEEEIRYLAKVEESRTYSTRLVDLMDDKGAQCFYSEAPQTGYPLAQRIKMNLISTDRILARYFLGI